VKRLLVLLTLIFGLGQAWATISATVTNSNVGAGSATTLTLTLAGTNAGELVVVGTVCYDATATITAAITGEGAMTAIGAVLRNATWSNAAQQLFYFPVLATGGSKTITFTYTNTCFAETVGGSFAGATATPFDVQNQVTTSTASVTTTAANDMIFGMATNGTTPITPTDDGGYTAILFTSNVQAGKGFYNLNVGVAGAHSVTSSSTVSIAAFKAAAGGGSAGSRAALTGAGK
jgi:hypothetical protein